MLPYLIFFSKLISVFKLLIIIGIPIILLVFCLTKVMLFLEKGGVDPPFVRKFCLGLLETLHNTIWSKFPYMFILNWFYLSFINSIYISKFTPCSLPLNIFITTYVFWFVFIYVGTWEKQAHVCNNRKSVGTIFTMPFFVLYPMLFTFFELLNELIFINISNLPL